jgi:glycerol uptake facilitator-like aquaporin
MKKYIWEALGVFLFCLFVSLIWNNNTGIMAPLAVGLAWYAVQAVFSTEGGWYGNPAFLTADLLLDRVANRQLAPYVFLAQVVGALLSIPFILFLLGCSGITETEMVHPDPFCAFFAEFICTFVLTLTYLRPLPGAAGVQGVQLAVLLFAFAQLSAGAYNPVLALAYALSERITWGDFSYYAAADLLGAAAAASLLLVLVPPTE